MSQIEFKFRLVHSQSTAVIPAWARSDEQLSRSGFNPAVFNLLRCHTSHELNFKYPPLNPDDWKRDRKSALEMEVWAFVSIKKVIWDWNYPEVSFFNFYVIKATVNKLSALHTVLLCFCFVLFCNVARQGHFLSKSPKKSWKRCSHSIFSSQDIILDFLTETSIHVFQLLWATITSLVA